MKPLNYQTLRDGAEGDELYRIADILNGDGVKQISLQGGVDVWILHKVEVGQRHYRASTPHQQRSGEIWSEQMPHITTYLGGGVVAVVWCVVAH